MQKRVNSHSECKLDALDASELTQINGGIWDYSNRLGFLGQHLENRPGRNYGVSFNPKNLDEAARQALQGWITIP
jgi:hypothetical protein